VGACIDPYEPVLVTEYCPRGSLQVRYIVEYFGHLETSILDLDEVFLDELKLVLDLVE
jgi:hypothetical protein